MCTENMTRVTMKRILVVRVWLAGALGETWLAKRWRETNSSRPAKPAEALIVSRYP
jgi:hypothetical protein